MRDSKEMVTRPEPRVGPGTGDRVSPLVWSAALGAVALWSVMLGASMEVSPFTSHANSSWLFSTATGSNHDMIVSVVLVYGGLLLFARVWLDLVRWLEASPGFPVVRLVPVFALWVLPMLVVPPLFSKDVYSYAAQGEMVSHGLNPYLWGPKILGGTHFLDPKLADPMWQNSPTPYGPLVLWLDGLVVKADGHSVLATVIVMRLLALAGVVLAALYIPRLARCFGRDRAPAFAIAILNPVTLFHLIGGAHNDALMIGLLVAGIALAKEGRPVVGIVLCSLASAIKAPAELAVVYIGWEWLGTHLSLRDRIRPVLRSLMISGVVMGVISWLSGLGWGWIGALGTPGTVVSMITPTTLLGTFLGHTAHFLGIGVQAKTMLSIARALGLLAAFGGCLALLFGSRRFGSLRALAMSLLLVVLLGPVVQPWYLAWGLLLAAPVATGKLRKVVFTLSVAVCFLGLPGARQLLSFLIPHNFESVLFGFGIIVLVLITPLKGWGKRLLALRATATKGAGGAQATQPSGRHAAL